MEHIQITDAESALLGLIAEAGPVSGYRLMTLAAERRMLQWASLSPSNVYNSLKKLRGNELVSAVQDIGKRGRGPAGLHYTISETGRTALRHQIESSLVQGREQSASFKLALAFCACIQSQRIAALLAERGTVLHERLRQVKAARAEFDADDNAPLPAALLFDYVAQSLEHEMKMAQRLALAVSKGGGIE